MGGVCGKAAFEKVELGALVGGEGVVTLLSRPKDIWER